MAAATSGGWGMEAAAAFLDRRHPGTRAGFVVSITHGSRAHYVRLDDPGAVASVPRFAAYIAAIYERASAADDAHSSWLCWMRPDGRLEALFDVLEPIPGLDRLPAEFAALACFDPSGRGRISAACRAYPEDSQRFRRSLVRYERRADLDLSFRRAIRLNMPDGVR